MTNLYECTFWDYYDFEMKHLTKKFKNFKHAKNYAVEILNKNTIPTFRFYRNNIQISLNNGKATYKKDSR